MPASVGRRVSMPKKTRTLRNSTAEYELSMTQWGHSAVEFLSVRDFLGMLTHPTLITVFVFEMMSVSRCVFKKPKRLSKWQVLKKFAAFCVANMDRGVGRAGPGGPRTPLTFRT